MRKIQLSITPRSIASFMPLSIASVMPRQYQWAPDQFKEVTPATSEVITEVSLALSYPEPFRVTDLLPSLLVLTYTHVQVAGDNQLAHCYPSLTRHKFANLYQAVNGDSLLDESFKNWCLLMHLAQVLRGQQPSIPPWCKELGRPTLVAAVRKTSRLCWRWCSPYY